MDTAATKKRQSVLRGLPKLIVACLLFLATGSVYAQQNLIENGDFETGDLTAWAPFVADFAGVSASISAESNAAEITGISGAGSQSWHIQLNQEFTDDQISQLEVGKIYTISFYASSPVEGRVLRLFFGQNVDPFNDLVFEDFELSPTLSKYSFSFVMKETYAEMKLGFEAGLSNDDVTIDNVSMVEGGIINNGDFATADFTDWSTGFFEGASATIDASGGAASITDVSITGSPQTWHIQLWQPLTKEQIDTLETGVNYTASFYASSSVEGRPLKLFFGEDGGGFVALADSTFEISTTAKRYQIVFPMTQTFGSMKLGFEAGTSNGDVTIDNVILNKGGDLSENDPPDEEPEPEPTDPNPPLGDEFIFFVEGANTAVPRVDGFKKQDPIEPERGFVQEIGGGAFFQNGFFWEEEGGIDITQNINDIDTVFMKVRLNPSDFGNNEERFTMGLTIADVTNGTDNDLQFGITWRFPPEYYDNTWHNVEIPLPKATWAAHDSALKDLDIDGNPLPPEDQYNEAQRRWTFDPAWSSETFSEVGPGDDRFEDVEWENTGRFAFSLNNDGGGVINVDDFWIGSSSTDLSVATSAATAASGLTATNIAEDSVKVNWDAAADDVGSFDLYYSGSEITDVTAENVFFLGNFNAGEVPEFTHAAFLPHPSLQDGTYNYAVVANNKWGFAPSDAPLSKTNTTISGELLPHIFNLSSVEQDAIFDMLINGEIVDDNLPFAGEQPFTLGSEDFVSESDAYNGLDDASANVYVAYGSQEDGGETFNTFFFYIEALDDDIRGGPSNNPGDMTGTMEYPNDETSVTWVPGPDSDPFLEWNYYLKDQIQVHFGTYFVDNFVTGTTHELRERGPQPDYYLSFQPIVDQAGDLLPSDMLTRMWLTEPATDDPNAEYVTNFYDSNAQLTFTPIYENILDESDNRIGWRALVAVDAFDLLKVDEDAEFTPPAADEVKLMPFMITLMDKDGEDPDAGNWWEVPSNSFNFPTRAGLGGGQGPNSSDISNLGVAAVVGADVVTSSEDDDAVSSTLPKKFSLEQNFPNPFNPSTTIRFELPQSADVSLTIYNVLGQRVAQLIGNQQMTAGTHAVSFDASRLSSGMYIYRIEAGSFTSTRKMMLIK